MQGTDLVGQWFELLRQAGEEIAIQYGWGEFDVIRWFELPHSHYDGLGGFWTLLRQHGSCDDVLPGRKSESRPSRISTLCFLPRMHRHFDRQKYRWKVAPASAEKAMPFPFQFSPEETKKLTGRANSLGISLNSLLLCYLNAAVRDFLEDEERPCYWMIPVNMRTEPSRQPGNRSAYIPCRITRNDDAFAVHQTVKEALRRGLHWHCWRWLTFGPRLGRRTMKFLFERNYPAQNWVGVFSNLGDWHWDGPGHWYFVPPCSIHAPVAVGAVTVNGSLCMAAQVHATWPASVAEEIAAKLRESVLATE